MNIDAFILCGGLGKRLNKIYPNTPKPLVKVKTNLVFIDLVINFLIDNEVSKITLCIFYLKDKMLNFIKRHNKKLLCSIEEVALGTGGAIKKAISNKHSNTILIVNGDSICNVNLNDVLSFHESLDSDITVVVSSNFECRLDVGFIEIDYNDNILKFSEKDKIKGTNFVNAGIYFIKKKYLINYDLEKFSLETDFIPNCLMKYSVKAYKTSEKIHDIGTPERLEKFRNIFERY